MGVLIILLLIPVGMIRSIIDERQDRYNDAVKEVSQKWGIAQEVTGPVLTIPYRTFYDETVQTTAGAQTVTKSKIEHLQILPEKLNYQGTLNPELKTRGIYEVVLYQLNLNTNGNFVIPSLETLGLEDAEMLWNEALVTVALPDTRGIQKEINLNWNGQTLKFTPGLDQVNFLAQANSQNFDNYEGASQYRYEPTWEKELSSNIQAQTGNFSGLQAQIPNLEVGETVLNFSYDLDIKGSQELSFWPTGKETTAQITSDWTSPSFDGYFLPETSDNNETFDDGFVANWKMSYFGRKYGQFWKSPAQDQTVLNGIQQSKFGLKLIVPIDFYQKNDRAIKYAILFIGMTFLTFFGFEILKRYIRVHPLQYLLIGFAMCVFYLLLLSFSEQIGFTAAYIFSSVATIGLITFYSYFVLQAKTHAYTVGLVLLFVYLLLFILLQLKDYALMVGSVTIFLVLATIMWVTRKIDWYNLDMGSEVAVMTEKKVKK